MSSITRRVATVTATAAALGAGLLAAMPGAALAEKGSLADTASSVTLQPGQEFCIADWASTGASVSGFASPLPARFRVYQAGVLRVDATVNSFSRQLVGGGYILLCAKGKLGATGPTNASMSIVTW